MKLINKISLLFLLGGVSFNCCAAEKQKFDLEAHRPANVYKESPIQSYEGDLPSFNSAKESIAFVKAFITGEMTFWTEEQNRLDKENPKAKIIFSLINKNPNDMTLRLKTLSSLEHKNLYDLYKSYYKIVTDIKNIDTEFLNSEKFPKVFDSLNSERKFLENQRIALRNYITEKNKNTLFYRGLAKEKLGYNVRDTIESQKNQFNSNLDNSIGKFYLIDCEYIKQYIWPVIHSIFTKTEDNFEKMIRESEKQISKKPLAPAKKKKKNRKKKETGTC